MVRLGRKRPAEVEGVEGEVILDHQALQALTLAHQHWQTDEARAAWAAVRLQSSATPDVPDAPARYAVVDVQAVAQLVYARGAPYLFDRRADNKLRWAVKESAKLLLTVVDGKIQRHHWPVPRPPLRTQPGHDFLADVLAYGLSLAAAYVSQLDYTVVYSDTDQPAGVVRVDVLSAVDPKPEELPPPMVEAEDAEDEELEDGLLAAVDGTGATR